MGHFGGVLGGVRLRGITRSGDGYFLGSFLGDFAKSFSFVASGEKDGMITVPRLAGRSSAW